MQGERTDDRIRVLHPAAIIHRLKALAPALLLAPIAYDWYFLASHFTPVPWGDDFTSIVAHAIVTPLRAHLNDIIAFHGLYRFGLVHAFTDLQLLLLGRVHIGLFFLCSNLALIGIVLLFWRHFALELLYFVPVAYLLFQLQYWESALWAQVSLLYCGTACVAMLSFHYVTRGSLRGVVVAFGMAMVAMYSFGNGLLVFVVGLLALAADGRSKRAWWWLGGFAILLVLYFHDIRPDPGIPSATALLRHPLMVLRGFFGFVGAMFNVSPYGPAIAFWAGLFLFASYAYLVLVARLHRANPFLFCCLTFTFLTAALVAAGRLEIADGYRVFRSRYTFWSALLVTATYLSFVQSIAVTYRDRFYSVALVCAIALNILLNRQGAAPAARLVRSIEISYVEFMANPDTGLMHTVAPNALINPIYQKALDTNIIDRPQVDVRALASSRRDDIRPASHGRMAVQRFESRRLGDVMFCRFYLKKGNPDGGTVFIGLSRPGRSAVFYQCDFTGNRYYDDVATIGSGFVAIIPMSELSPDGPREVSICINENGTLVDYRTTETLR